MSHLIYDFLVAICVACFGLGVAQNINIIPSLIQKVEQVEVEKHSCSCGDQCGCPANKCECSVPTK